MRMRNLLALCISILLTPFANAAFITIDEAGMDLVFSQASFGARTIDIRVDAAQELVAPTLLDITTDAEIGSLFSSHTTFGAATDAVFYFVDTIDSCGGFNPAIVGCGEKPGNDFVVESVFANSPFNAELLAHELGHNLDLGHRTNGTSLMNPQINNGIDLISSEIATIFANVSGLVKQDLNGFYINIKPVLVVAVGSPVPEPATLGLLLLGLGGLVFQNRRQPRASV